jgi:hypothetical protein
MADQLISARTPGKINKNIVNQPIPITSSNLPWIQVAKDAPYFVTGGW